MVDYSRMKLGKAPVRRDARTFLFAKYFDSTKLPAIPPSLSWAEKVSVWGMMLNDNVGDCTCAAAGHLIELWTANNGNETVPPDPIILGAYEVISGYDPNTPANDPGAVELDVLKYWRTTGIGQDKIQAFVGLDEKNTDHVRASVYLFGGCYIGLRLPNSAQTQDVWSVPPGGPTGDGLPGSWGGHAVPIVAYDTSSATVVTWGQLKKMTWEFYTTYCDEAYALLSQDWSQPGRLTPAGFDFVGLQADLQAVAGP